MTIKTTNKTNEAKAVSALQRTLRLWKSGADIDTLLASARHFMAVAPRAQRQAFLQALASGANARAQAAAAEARAISERMNRQMGLAPTRGANLVESVDGGHSTVYRVPLTTARA